jgi:hypothetical protein
VVEDECSAHIAHPRNHFQIEDTIERWETGDVEVGATVAHGVDVGLDALYPQIPQIRKLADEVKDLLVVSPRLLQFQGF